MYWYGVLVTATFFVLPTTEAYVACMECSDCGNVSVTRKEFFCTACKTTTIKEGTNITVHKTCFRKNQTIGNVRDGCTMDGNMKHCFCSASLCNSGTPVVPPNLVALLAAGIILIQLFRDHAILVA